MDPDTEEGYKSLLKEWQKQDDDIRDRLKSIDEKTETTHELLRDLKDHVVSLGGIPGKSIKLCNWQKLKYGFYGCYFIFAGDYFLMERAQLQISFFLVKIFMW